MCNLRKLPQEVKLSVESEENIALGPVHHENVQIEVVSVEGADSGAAGDDGGEVIEQQHLLPGTDITGARYRRENYTRYRR